MPRQSEAESRGRRTARGRRRSRSRSRSRGEGVGSASSPSSSSSSSPICDSRLPLLSALPAYSVRLASRRRRCHGSRGNKGGEKRRRLYSLESPDTRYPGSGPQPSPTPDAELPAAGTRWVGAGKAARSAPRASRRGRGGSGPPAAAQWGARGRRRPGRDSGLCVRLGQGPAPGVGLRVWRPQGSCAPVPLGRGQSGQEERGALRALGSAGLFVWRCAGPVPRSSAAPRCQDLAFSL